MLFVALAVTFGTASFLQEMAVARGVGSNEPFFAAEASRSVSLKAAPDKVQITSQLRERGVSTTSMRVGL